MTNANVYKGFSACGCITLVGIFLCLGLVTVITVYDFSGSSEVHQKNYSESKDSVQSAVIELNVDVGMLEMNTLAASDDLFQADISYTDELDYQVTGSETRYIKLNQTGKNYGFNAVLNLFKRNDTSDENALLWAINLSPDVPLELIIEGGVGDFDLDLYDLYITELQLKTGVGETTLKLAPPQQSYRVTIESGVGDTTIILPPGVAVRVESEIGMGNVHFPAELERINGDDQKGIWEMNNFEAAEVQITIIITGGVGSLTVQ